MKSCDEVQQELVRALDGDPESLAALQHLKLCESCAALARELAKLDRELHESLGRIEEAPAGFVSGVLSRLPRESPVELARHRSLDLALEILGWILGGGSLWVLLFGLGIFPDVSGIETGLTAGFGTLLGEAATWFGEIGAWLADLSPDPSRIPTLELDPTWILTSFLVAIGLQALAARGLSTRGA